jgi:hypothetical protein
MNMRACLGGQVMRVAPSDKADLLSARIGGITVSKEEWRRFWLLAKRPDCSGLFAFHLAQIGSALVRRIAVDVTFGLVFDCFAGFLNVLACTGHGVAGGQRTHRKQGQQHQGNQTLHVVLLGSYD